MLRVRIATWLRTFFYPISFCAMALCLFTPSASAQQNELEIFRHAQKLQEDGNYKDALESYRTFLKKPDSRSRNFGEALVSALQCLSNLGLNNDSDELIELAVRQHPENWHLLLKAAENYHSSSYWYGYIVGGKFQRGYLRGGDGKYVSAEKRDRVSALRLLLRALEAVKNGQGPAAEDRDKEGLWLYLAELLLWNTQGFELLALTDLETLPDYDENAAPYWARNRPNSGRAPVDAQGVPIYYVVPESFASAKSDGERVRFALKKMAEIGAPAEARAQLRYVQFLTEQFGTETLIDSVGAYHGRMLADDATGGELENDASDVGKQNENEETGTYALHTLREDETIARLSTGIQRFTLPTEHNFIAILQGIAKQEDSSLSSERLEALRRLATLFENRRQFPRAAEYWQLAGDTAHVRLILGAWGRFEPTPQQPFGKSGELRFVYRNGQSVQLEAFEIDSDRLLEDTMRYLQSDPAQFDYSGVQIENLGYSILQENQKKYIGRRVHSWQEKLHPKANHFDTEQKISIPLEKPGAYLITAKISGGNKSDIVFWLTPGVILRKSLDAGSNFYFVADALTGKPVQNAQVKFFGYKTEYLQWERYIPGTRQFHVRTRTFEKSTDKNGQIIVNKSDQIEDYQWLAIASANGQTLANLGFGGIWYSSWSMPMMNQIKTYLMTDRPVYRPGQRVQFKVWVARANYESDGSNDFSGKSFSVEIKNPRGEKIFEKNLTGDEFGGVHGELELPKDATLGAYSLIVLGYGGGSFRVEEYKKPEFEVKVESPNEPIKLGEKIQAKVKARYYFGAPVNKATVRIKVEREEFTSRWYPVSTWDWLYGAGYWWFAYDYRWFPGFSEWGCLRPFPFWFPRQSTPPELVQTLEVPINADGIVDVSIDTSRAKELQGDRDHKYVISAEVVDDSRRMISGRGEVLATRKPYEVYAWVDRGYYHPGEPIQAQFSARTAAGKSVQGDGKIQLFKISYDSELKPHESLAQSWAMPTGEDGTASLQLKAGITGQYRLTYTVTDAAQHSVTGGYIFSIVGEGEAAGDYRFNDLEIIPDKREYAPGERVHYRLNTAQSDSTVLLFARPSNGIYLAPDVIHVSGKSVQRELLISAQDMPNIFLEAVTIRNGKIYNEVKEIFVPPAKKVLNVAIESKAETYKPGEQATYSLRVTDAEGKPFEGTAVLTAYDAALEYISKGSNIPEIRSFFWKWRRTHSLRQYSNLSTQYATLTESGEEAMEEIGVFGGGLELEEMQGEAPGALRAKSTRMANAAPAPMVAAEGMALRGGAASNELKKNSIADSKADAAFSQAIEGNVGAPSGEAGGASDVEPTIRKEFADTAYWNAQIETDKEGRAQVSFKMPENLTEWKVRTWVIGKGTQVGEGTATVSTTKNLLLRMQAPRFFVEKDEVVLSGNVHNYLKSAKTVRAKLELVGEELSKLDGEEKQVRINPGEEARVDWRVKVKKEGKAVVRMAALSDEESDAVQMEFPVYVHGMLRTESYSGAIRGEAQEGGLKFSIPAERRPEQSRVEIRYSPSLAGAMIDALPYLVNFPYGCTEQTLNRFLPTAVVEKVLLNMKLHLKDIQEKRTNLNAQEIGDSQERAKRWKQYSENPVFDEAEVGRMSRAGLERLVQMQLSDGGWGWFSGTYEHSDAHMTAYVVHGLQIASSIGLSVEKNVLSRGLSWLEYYQSEQVQMIKNAPKEIRPWKSHADNLDAFVFMVLSDADKKDEEMLKFLYRDRNELAVYGKAAFGLALFAFGEKEKLGMIMQNIEQYLVEDAENQTAYLNLGNQGYWWYWYGSEYEAQAYYLKLLSRVEPQSKKASGLVKYLLNNRKNATYWNSTRDTAIVLEAFADYLKASGESQPDMTVKVVLDGKEIKSVRITPENFFSFDGTVLLTGDAVTTGEHSLRILKSGKGPLYFNAYVSNFSLEDKLKSAGLEIKVQRKFYKLRKQESAMLVEGVRGQALNQQTEKYVREPLEDGATLKSGDLVEVELEIESKNDYEYLLFEDYKPAGFEPLEVQSGYNGNDLGAYVEFRDERVAFFSRMLSRGKHSVSYRLRAEIPGVFSALPTKASAMYAPELKANADEVRLGVVD